MIRLTILTCLGLSAALPTWADPAFKDRASGLPGPQVYDGEWEHYVGGGVAIFDCDGDAKPDLFAAGGSTAAGLFRNTTAAAGGDITFERVSFPETTGVTGAYPLDVDGDDLLDLMVLRVGPNLLLQGQGGCQFKDRTAEWGLEPGDQWSTAFSATWEKGRTWPTFVVGNYVDLKDPTGPFEACDKHQIHRGGEGRFEPAEEIAPGYCALSMLISDWRRSGTPELRISNDRQYYVRAGYEQMFTLSPLKEYGEAENWPKIKLWGMGIASRDITGDGLPEVMLTSMADQVLQINKGDGTLANAPYAIGTYATIPYIGDDGRPSTGWHAEFGDIDNDGRDDLFIAKGNVNQMPSNAIHDPNNLLMQQEDGHFVEKGAVAGVATGERSRGAGLVDLNADGLLDIVVVNRRASMEIWQNITDGSGNWVGLDLHQPGPNRRAVGAWVELRAGGKVQSQEITVGGGHVSGQAGPLHFGLGTSDKADLRVIWPDGAVSDWLSVPVGQVVAAERDGNSLRLK
ncbi:CRTAC1 family protein [Thioclava sp. FR2]|uniref:CRTAC1 family protein n=1 Tax=Thioclava sp. FR2 TaxID=3445780 RepID=UPI003EC06909